MLHKFIDFKQGLLKTVWVIRIVFFFIWVSSYVLLARKRSCSFSSSNWWNHTIIWIHFIIFFQNYIFRVDIALLRFTEGTFKRLYLLHFWLYLRLVSWQCRNKHLIVNVIAIRSPSFLSSYNLRVICKEFKLLLIIFSCTWFLLHYLRCYDLLFEWKSWLYTILFHFQGSMSDVIAFSSLNYFF